MSLAPVFAATAVVTAVATAGSWWALRHARTAALVGDEHEYAPIVDGRPGPAPFQRMPAHRWLLRWGCSVHRVRWITAGASVLATAAATMVAAEVAGAWAALAAGLLAACSSERLLLGTRLWPDPLLAVGQTVFVAACVPTLDVPWAVAAVVCAAVSLVRIDGVTSAACLAVAVQAPAAGRAAIVIAGVAPVVVLWLVHRRRGGATPVETTSWFNLRLSAARLGAAAVQPLEPAIGHLADVWAAETDAERRAAYRIAITAHVRHPLQWAAAVVVRLIGLCGIDSFSKQRLLPSYSPALPRTVRTAATGLGAGLVALAAAGAGGCITPRVALLVGLQALVVAAFHTRTRFRAALLPGVLVLAAAGLHQLVAAHPGAIIGAVAGLTAAALATRFDLLERSRPGRDRLI